MAQLGTPQTKVENINFASQDGDRLLAYDVLNYVGSRLYLQL